MTYSLETGEGQKECISYLNFAKDRSQQQQHHIQYSSVYKNRQQNQEQVAKKMV